MTVHIRYLTHPQVKIEPAVPVPSWGLSDVGRLRTEALANAEWLSETPQIISSGERKAIETAAIRVDVVAEPQSDRKDPPSAGLSTRGCGRRFFSSLGYIDAVTRFAGARQVRQVASVTRDGVGALSEMWPMLSIDDVCRSLCGHSRSLRCLEDWLP
jgi:broad specificity phosphatase PhoE